jgi:hypothetical protein
MVLVSVCAFLVESKLAGENERFCILEYITRTPDEK